MLDYTVIYIISIIEYTTGMSRVRTYSGYVSFSYVRQGTGVGYLGCRTELIWLSNILVAPERRNSWSCAHYVGRYEMTAVINRIINQRHNLRPRVVQKYSGHLNVYVCFSCIYEGFKYRHS